MAAPPSKTVSRPKPGGSASSQRPKCPVCQQPVFSPSGVHPQCAAEESSRVETQRLKAQLTAEAAAAPPSTEPATPTKPGMKWRGRSPKK